MRNYLACFLVIVIAVTLSCEPSLKVSTDYDKAVNFGQYKTFSMYQDVNIHDAISQLNQDRIINAIKSEMTKKGFQENTSSPDVLVNVVAILKDRVEVSSTTNYYGYGGVYRPYYYGGAGAGGRERRRSISARREFDRHLQVRRQHVPRHLLGGI